jgi:hypothetical protein
VRVDYYLPPATPLRDVPAETSRVAQIGFDGLFTAETSHDPFIPLALAAQTEPASRWGLRSLLPSLAPR